VRPVVQQGKEPPGADHKNAALFTPQICFKGIKTNEDHISLQGKM